MTAAFASLVWWAGGIGAVVLAVRTIVDVADHTRVAFYAAGYSRSAWLVVLGAGIFLWPAAFVASLVYWLRARPRVVRAERALAPSA